MRGGVSLSGQPPSVALPPREDGLTTISIFLFFIEPELHRSTDVDFGFFRTCL